MKNKLKLLAAIIVAGIGMVAMADVVFCSWGDCPAKPLYHHVWHGHHLPPPGPYNPNHPPPHHPHNHN